MKNRPDISVVLAAYNGERYIQEQIESILPQLDPKRDELIVTLDPSADRTGEILETIHHPCLRVIEGPGQGVIANFENGLRHASKEIIFLSDQDDRWREDKVSCVLDCFDHNPQALLVLHDASLIDADGNVTEPSFFQLHRSRNGLIRNIIRNSMIGCCMAFSRTLLEDILPFGKHIPMHDQWIGLQALKKGKDKVIFLKKPLTAYRRHENNATSMKSASIRQQAAWRLGLIADLLRAGK